MNIILRRIEKALRLTYRTSQYRQAQKQSQRRGSYQNGVVRFPHTINFRMSEELMDRLTRICQTLNVERGVIVRDALEFYIGIAETEMHEKPVTAQDVRRRA